MQFDVHNLNRWRFDGSYCYLWIGDIRQIFILSMYVLRLRMCPRFNNRIYFSCLVGERRDASSDIKIFVVEVVISVKTGSHLAVLCQLPSSLTGAYVMFDFQYDSFIFLLSYDLGHLVVLPFFEEDVIDHYVTIYDLNLVFSCNYFDWNLL